MRVWCVEGCAVAGRCGGSNRLSAATWERDAGGDNREVGPLHTITRGAPRGGSPTSHDRLHTVTHRYTPLHGAHLEVGLLPSHGRYTPLHGAHLEVGLRPLADRVDHRDRVVRVRQLERLVQQIHWQRIDARAQARLRRAHTNAAVGGSTRAPRPRGALRVCAPSRPASSSVTVVITRVTNPLPHAAHESLLSRELNTRLLLPVLLPDGARLSPARSRPWPSRTALASRARSMCWSLRRRRRYRQRLARRSTSRPYRCPTWHRSPSATAPALCSRQSPHPRRP